MTRYLLDRDVMSQLDQPENRRHLHVRAWLRSVPDNILHVSVITVVEAWRGLALARRGAADDTGRLIQCQGFEHAFERLVVGFDDRVAVADAKIAKLWGRLRGRLDRNQWDLGLAASAIVNDMVIATRNVADFTGRGVRGHRALPSSPRNP